jgi:hypothetical protein
LIPLENLDHLLVLKKEVESAGILPLFIHALLLFLFFLPAEALDRFDAVNELFTESTHGRKI